jgi:hypothetical protein
MMIRIVGTSPPPFATIGPATNAIRIPPFPFLVVFVIESAGRQCTNGTHTSLRQSWRDILLVIVVLGMVVV